MTESKCPSCGRTDLGDGRFCPGCRQMLNAPKGVRLASYEQRLRGFIVDGFVLFVALIVGVFAVVELFDIVIEPPNLLVIALVVMAGGLFGLWSLWWLLVLNSSQTPGKQLAGIRVMNATTGEPAGFVRTFFRESIAKSLTGAVFGWFFGMHILWALWDPDRQGLYDKFAGTVVVDDKEYRLQS